MTINFVLFDNVMTKFMINNRTDAFVKWSWCSSVPVVLIQSFLFSSAGTGDDSASLSSELSVEEFNLALCLASCTE